VDKKQCQPYLLRRLRDFTIPVEFVRIRNQRSGIRGSAKSITLGFRPKVKTYTRRQKVVLFAGNILQKSTGEAGYFLVGKTEKPLVTTRFARRAAFGGSIRNPVFSTF
jgi:hypothetical protein